MHTFTRLVPALAFACLVLTPDSRAQAGPALPAAAVDEVLNISLTQKKGMTIYLGGQVINCLFVKRIDANTIEVRNQTHSRILIRLDRVDAIALS
jgi:hypothetical protein